MDDVKLFACQHCGQLLDFENTMCERCGRALGYLPERATLTALDPNGSGLWRPLAAPETLVHLCANAAHDACNWLIPDGSPETYCPACRLNRTIPDLNIPENLERWRRFEAAKHRLVYGLLRLGLPLANKFDDPVGGLAFDFLTSTVTPFGDESVVTGHRHGLITIDVFEADDAEREQRRRSFAEPYRTPLGHLRHEAGHYYWGLLIAASPWQPRFRAVFGDDRLDYNASLLAHHTGGPPEGWEEHFVTTYASAHPWEDFAEIWAHYLHILDTLETASAFGLTLQPQAGVDLSLHFTAGFDPYDSIEFSVLIQAWLPLAHAANSLARSMGHPDLYPFVLRPAVLDKLRWIHDFTRDVTRSRAAAAHS